MANSRLNALDEQAEPILSRLRERWDDERAWTAFYEVFRPQVVAMLFYRGVRSAVERDELTAEVFFRFLATSEWASNWGSLPTAEAVRKYLVGKASSLASHAAEKRQRRANLEHEMTEVEVERASLTAARDHAMYLDLLDILNELDEPDRKLLWCYYELHFSLGALADHYGIKYSAAGVRLHRVRRKILARLREKSGPKRKKPESSGHM